MKTIHRKKTFWLALCLTGIFLAGIFTNQIVATQGISQMIQIAEEAFEVELIGESTYRSSLDNYQMEMPQRPFIKLNYKTFDPLNEAITIDNPAMAAISGSGETLYIVQFHTQAFEAYQNQIMNLGGKVVEAIPDHALIIQMDSTLSSAIAQLPFVRWVGPYYPAYKIDAPAAQTAGISADTSKCYSIWLSSPEYQTELSSFVEQIGGTSPGIGDSRRMEAALTQDQLMELAMRNEVLAIDECTDTEDDMDGAREASGANYIETVKGYTGQGVGAEVMDRGFRVSHNDFKANPPLVHSPSHHWSGYGPGSMGHGTQCAGIVFGSGASNSRARGLLPDAARPIVASRFSLWSGTSGHPTLFQRKTHTQELNNPSGVYRAVFQTNSWGQSRTRSYTTISAEMDEIIFDLDFLILQSQSNAGNQDSRPQAWAKNIVSVGGIKSGDTLSRSDDCWGCNVGGISSSASIGPASDGRIKPDLSHFYGKLYTSDDSGDTAHTEFGGTSGATPAAAGLFGLMYQMWADGILDGAPGQNRDVFNSRPHAATAKALMINTAYEYSFNGSNSDLTRVHQGWGMPDVKKLYDMAKDHNWNFPVLIDESAVISAIQTHSYTVNCNASKPLRATMVYSDPAGTPNSSVHRVNDLSLKVTSPSGTIYWGNNGLLSGNYSTSGGTSNTIDTVENVFIQSPASGNWTIEIVASEIVKDGHTETPAMDADYALVVSGGTTGTNPGTKYTLTTNVTGQGSITLNPAGGTYDAGTSVTLTPNPASGWTFSNWSGDLTGSANPDSITMTANKAVTAVFTQSGPGDQELLNGQAKTVSGIKGEWKHFFVNVPSGANNLVMKITGSSVDDADLYTKFGSQPTSSSWDCRPYKSGSNEDCTVPTPQTGKYYVSIYAYSTYSNASLTASYALPKTTQYNLIVNNSGQGSVTLDPPGGTYDPGTSVKLTATPSANWTFSGWSGDLSGSTYPDTLIMNANKTVTATFNDSGTPDPKSCVGNCGSSSADGSCWCDSTCASYNDCCADKVQACGN